MPLLTHKDLHWFHQANAAAGYWLKQDFYAFKKRFLHLHATPAGYDLQKIDKPCWGCEGTGEVLGSPCMRCYGSGVFSTKEIVLRRFDLSNRTYHIPTEPCEIDQNSIRFESEIEGLITHAPVSPSVGTRSYLRLLLRHEPTRFYHIALEWLVRRSGSNRWLFRLIRLRNQLDLFPCIEIQNPDQTVPF